MKPTEQEVVVQENGEKEEDEKEETIETEKRKLGGMKTMSFILGKLPFSSSLSTNVIVLLEFFATEVCDRFVGAGFHSNLITYPTQVLNVPPVKASNTLANFSGVSNFTPIIGALVAERFWTIIVGSIIYEMGMVSITVSAIMPQLRPPPCPTQENYKEASNHNFGIAMALSVVAFVIGSPLYRKVEPGASPFIRLTQVIVASVKKRRVVVPAMLNCYCFTNLTNWLRWIDRAAVVTDDDMKESNLQPNLWLLATVHRIEELKCILRMVPIWAAGILHFASHSHVSKFTIQQAHSMDRHLSNNFQIPPASLAIFSVLTVLIGLALHEGFFVPFARRFTGRFRKDDLLILCNDESVEYVETKVNTDLAEFLHQGTKNIELLNDLLLWCVPPGAHLPSSPLLGVQVNIFNCGGLVMGIQISHVLTDAFTLATFVNEWAPISQTGTTKANYLPNLSHLPSLVPTRVPSGPQFSPTSDIGGAKIVTRRFLFDALTITKLKSNSSATLRKPTRAVVVLSVIWKVLVGISSAKHGHSRDSSLCVTFGLRGKSSIPSSEHALGNFVMFGIADLEANQLREELMTL
ncbi:hypothetical protein K7X08_023263 [Anisodus acutangulus]|uniref:Uncharacterized protein n=1 Tax=Anisodus acutangulus TaxID=402998 RepID=A0A9Q1LEJ5_9SOLA|nr:hypothetical protein K7X08_023263 [Anisodus acutangulus]